MTSISLTDVLTIIYVLLDFLKNLQSQILF